MASRNSVESRNSRYTQGGETEKFEKRLGWWERDIDTFVQRDDDILVTISPRYDKRPDKMSTDFFGQSSLQWVILQFNNIVDINEEFVAGKEIRIPNPARVQFTFLNKRTGGVSPSTE